MAWQARTVRQLSWPQGPWDQRKACSAEKVLIQGWSWLVYKLRDSPTLAQQNLKQVLMSGRSKGKSVLETALGWVKKNGGQTNDLTHEINGERWRQRQTFQKDTQCKRGGKGSWCWLASKQKSVKWLFDGSWCLWPWREQRESHSKLHEQFKAQTKSSQGALVARMEVVYLRLKTPLIWCWQRRDEAQGEEATETVQLGIRASEKGSLDKHAKAVIWKDPT